MGLLQKIFGEKRGEEEQTITPIISEELLRIILEGGGIGKEAALSVPAIASAVNLISSIGANITYKLYTKDANGRLTEPEDERVELINGSTGDLLNGYEMKRAFLRDYLLLGNGYIYKNTVRNRVKSLHYVKAENVSINTNTDAIFKKALYNVQGREYYPHEFITMARNTADGVRGEGLVTENKLIIRLINNMLKMLNTNVASGGLKKGFLQSERTLAKEEMSFLKESFERLYGSAEGKVIVLNKGVRFEEAQESSTEMQLKDMYDDISDDIGEILILPENIRNGSANKDEYRNWFKNCINPIAREFTAALDEVMLLEREKGKYFWKADTSELENGDIRDLLEAYKIGVDSNIIQLDEARAKLGFEPIGFDFMKIGLDSVLMDVKKKLIYTPNTNMMQDMSKLGQSIGGNGGV